ncbi:MAG: fatty acid desaturase family protein [Coraliomargarita sp.]
MGIAINSLGILIHEGLHGLLAKDSTINHGLSFLCGLPLLISSTAYQVTHNDHHFELGRKLDYGTYKQHMDKKWMVWSAYLAQLSFGSILYILLIPLLAFKSVNLKARCTILLEYCLIAVFLFLLHKYLTYEELMTYWILPACGMILLTNIRGLASHALGDYDDIYLSSRTIGCNKLTSVLFLHENYHLEHHLFPQVPSYNLKHTHNLIWRRLPRALYAKSYLHFLFGFFNALVSRDLQPMGIVRPQSKFASNNQI